MASPAQSIFVTFDTNTYSSIARPQLHMLVWKLARLKKVSWSMLTERLVWWYLNRCIKMGRIVAGIPEPALKAEVLRSSDRVSHLASLGTSKARFSDIGETRKEILKCAFEVGFRVQRCPRIAYGSALDLSEEKWFPDLRYSQAYRQSRDSNFVRHFQNFPLENLKDFGEQLSAAHNLAKSNPAAVLAARLYNITADRFLYREGLAAEEKSCVFFQTKKDFISHFRNLLAEWTDFDIVSTHFAYGFDVLCTNDKGNKTSQSIYGPVYASDLASVFNVSRMSCRALASHCWSMFGVPVRPWKADGK